jgi:hypothetical protein
VNLAKLSVFWYCSQNWAILSPISDRNFWIARGVSGVVFARRHILYWQSEETVLL